MYFGEDLGNRPDRAIGPVRLGASATEVIENEVTVGFTCTKECLASEPRGVCCLASAVNVSEPVKVIVPTLMRSVGHWAVASRVCGEQVGRPRAGGTDSVEVCAQDIIHGDTRRGGARKVVKETDSLFVTFGPVHKNGDVVRVKLDKANP
jgi:hypothetical protein